MVMECVAIVAVLCVVSLIMHQKGSIYASLAILPLYAVPGIYLLTGAVAGYLPLHGPDQLRFFLIACYLLALIVSCMVIGVLGKAVRRRRSRQAYYLLCGGFNLILALLFILNMV